MKLITKVTLMSMVFFLAFCLQLKQEAKEGEVDKKQWERLFSPKERQAQTCIQDAEMPTTNEDPYAAKKNRGPSAKSNPWDKKVGRGPSAYLFDFFDPLLQQPVTQYFKMMIQAVKKIRPPSETEFQDPYSLDNLVAVFTNATEPEENTEEGEQPKQEQPKPKIQVSEGYDLLSQHMKGFDRDVWERSISAGKIFQVFKNWGWKKPLIASLSNNDWVRRLIDKYDFDGNGRLDPHEFILLSIINNKGFYTDSDCKEYCFKNIIEEAIDPIFNHLDCKEDSQITAENMWLGLQTLKRNTQNYNMYGCLVPANINQALRTSATNDFFLKNHQQTNGLLTLDEFRIGILLGYWERQTNGTRIYMKDEINEKNLRWENNGMIDKECRTVRSLARKTTTYSVFPPRFDVPAPKLEKKRGGIKPLSTEGNLRNPYKEQEIGKPTNVDSRGQTREEDKK